MMTQDSVAARAQMTDGDDARWAALIAHRPDLDFFYGVTTTGIYCRPSCTARRPLRANTRFFTSFSLAEGAGFRACLRCRPNAKAPEAERVRLIERICRLIDEAESPPSLDALARAAGMSVYHLHRVFRAALGVTPKAYAAARRRERLQNTLANATSVTQAAFDAGYNSNSTLYANAATELGMSPTAYRDGAAHATIRYATGSCSLGAILVAATDRGICAIDLGDDAPALSARLRARFPQATLARGDAALERWLGEAVAQVDGNPGTRPQLALDITGTAFAQRVWAALRDVPYGETATYGEIARRVGSPAAARAVAKVCASNPVALVIPCHRIVREDGSETPYRWGAARKHELLRREREGRAASSEKRNA
jgi:AraC family transcriptional regulator of adaptative response/methylated-DNA-[protein]-cysteine methyltransferase